MFAIQNDWPNRPTSHGVPVKLEEVTENVFGETFLLRQTLKEHHHLHLAHSMHPLRRHTPALPVDIYHTFKITSLSFRIIASKADEELHICKLHFILGFKMEKEKGKQIHTVDKFDHSK